MFLRSENFSWSYVLRIVICMWIPWLLLFHDLEKGEISVLEIYHLVVFPCHQKATSAGCEFLSYKILWPIQGNFTSVEGPLLVVVSEKIENYSGKLHAGNFHFRALSFLIYCAHLPPFGGLFTAVYSIFLLACFSHILKSFACAFLKEEIQLRLADPGIYWLIFSLLIF